MIRVRLEDQVKIRTTGRDSRNRVRVEEEREILEIGGR